MRRLMHGVLLLVAAAASTGCTPEKDRLDAEVKRLCAIDGGMTVYETVTLPPEKFYENGTPQVPIGKDDKEFGYFSRSTQEHLAGQVSTLAGSGAGLKKSTAQVIRSADGKIMGESRVYSRHGGNLLDGYTQGGGFQCPTFEEVRDLHSKVFLKGDAK